MGLLSPISSAISGLLGGTLGSVVKLALSAVNAWIVAGAEQMLAEVVKVIGLVTEPSLSSSWFSSTYWRVSALAMLLTVPFLFAAAVQAILRSDLQLLLRAALIDLPIAVVAVYATAPVITLLLAATDEMCTLVTGGGPVGGSFLSRLPDDLSNAGSGFLIVVIAVVILIAGLMLLVELIIRSAAIYVVVLFLPLGFAAMVWPARRVWIKRMIETLTALILSKFAMVAILTLAVSALGSLTQDPSALTTALTAMALVVVATLSPWALLRLLPFTELAASAVGTLRSDVGHPHPNAQGAAQTTAAVGLGAVADPLAAGFGGLRRLGQSRGPGSANVGDPGGTALSVYDSANSGGRREGGDGAPGPGAAARSPGGGPAPDAASAAPGGGGAPAPDTASDSPPTSAAPRNSPAPPSRRPAASGIDVAGVAPQNPSPSPAGENSGGGAGSSAEPAPGAEPVVVGSARPGGRAPVRLTRTDGVAPSADPIRWGTGSEDPLGEGSERINLTQDGRGFLTPPEEGDRP